MILRAPKTFLEPKNVCASLGVALLCQQIPQRQLVHKVALQKLEYFHMKIVERLKGKT